MEPSMNREIKERVKKVVNKFYCVTIMWGNKYILTKVFKKSQEAEDYKEKIVSRKGGLSVRCFETTAFPKVKFVNTVDFSLRETNVAQILEMFEDILDFTKIEFVAEQSMLEELLQQRFEPGSINETIDMLSATSRYHMLISDYLMVNKLVVCSIWKSATNQVYRYPKNQEDILITFKINK